MHKTKLMKQMSRLVKFSAHDVEKAIVDWFLYRGGWAVIITVSGKPVFRGKQFICLRPNHDMRGMADVYGMLPPDGVIYRIEVKVGRDTESADQIRDRVQWEQAGGRSMIVKSIDDFLEQFGEFNVEATQ